MPSCVDRLLTDSLSIVLIVIPEVPLAFAAISTLRFVLTGGPLSNSIRPGGKERLMEPDRVPAGAHIVRDGPMPITFADSSHWNGHSLSPLGINECLSRPQG
jgi:hypothetical protein